MLGTNTKWKVTYQKTRTSKISNRSKQTVTWSTNKVKQNKTKKIFKAKGAYFEIRKF